MTTIEEIVRNIVRYHDGVFALGFDDMKTSGGEKMDKALRELEILLPRYIDERIAIAFGKLDEASKKVEL